MDKIGIAGVGGIGSNVAVNLVRSGILNLKIADYDKIEESNLNRQFYFSDQIGRSKVDALEENLIRINSKIRLEKLNILINKDNIRSIFNDCSIIVEGFDKTNDKTLLVNEFCDTGKFVVSACGVAGLGTDNIKAKRLQDNIYIVGDFHTDIKDTKL